MTHLFDNLPLHNKLIFVVTLICGILILLMSCLFVFDKINSFRESMVETHVTLIDTIAKSSSAALAFDDVQEARNTLAALRAAGDVVEATIISKDGEFFAVYSQKGGPHNATAVNRDLLLQIKQNPKIKTLHSFHDGYLDLATSISIDDYPLGFLLMRADLGRFYTKLWHSIGYISLISLVLWLIAQITSVRLHRTIMHPLQGLLSTMTAVKERKDYSLRSHTISQDEFGNLTDVFNEMVAEIERRDEELEEHRNQLEALVLTRTAELTATNQKLKEEIQERKAIQDQLARAQKMEAVGTLAAGVAHDLNNILSGIVSYPELLLLGISKDDRMYRPLNTIQTSGKKAAAIVQDMLTLARRSNTVMDTIDIEVVVDEYLTSPECKKMLEDSAGITIQKQIVEKNLKIQGSSIHLGKTIMNLIINSAEAMDAGQITVGLDRCYLERPIRSYDEVQEGEYIHLWVTDTGHGISEEDLKSIFEPFYTKKKMGRSGTGLGMAVVLGAVQDHNGYIDVSSTIGEGTTFDLYFPTTYEPLQKKAAEQVVDYSGRGEHILIIDDVEEQRIIATSIFKKLGYSAHAVESGEAALEYLANQQADLLVLDMIMDPGIDGIETYRQVIKRNPKQKAIIASGYSEMNRMQLARKLGIVSYIRKPYSISTIAQTVRKELDREEQITNEQDLLCCV